VGETRVDLQHLLEDLRDAYSGAVEQTILTEIVANALDSGATRIRIRGDATSAALTVVDDGRGMQRRELARYHDIAASTKARGEGIGFAGVGIKLGLLVSRDVMTETRRGATHVATLWHLKSRHRAPWKWIEPPGITTTRGTAVRLTLENPLSPLLDAGYLEETVRRHFEPLFDPAFDGILRRKYPNGIVFEIDDRVIARTDPRAQRAAVVIRLGRRRIPSAVGFIERHPLTQLEDRQGVAISTFGKVIRRGWDWLGLTPVNATRIGGVIEVPELAGCLTLNKNDFIRTGARGAAYLSYRKAIQEVVSRQLAAWGDAPKHDIKPRPERLERDLERVIDDLATDFPLLRSLVDRRSGGQKRLPMPGRGTEQVPGPLFGGVPSGHADDTASVARERPDDRPAAPEQENAAGEPAPSEPPKPVPVEPGTPEAESLPPPPQARGDGAEEIGSAPVGTGSVVPGRRRPARYGLLLQFESRPDELELARLLDSTIWINDAHPAYVRAAASRSSGYHVALSVAMALAPLAVGPAEEHEFVTQFLAHWGAAMDERRSPRRRRRRH
jgi:hypothetical protein